MSAVVSLVRGSREAPKSVRSSMETMIFTAKEAASWVIPPFQRPLRVNEKVKMLAEELRHNGGFVTGVLTLGRLSGDKSLYVVDGQHRIEAFKISELQEGIADVRVCAFDSMADMADEFVMLQQSLVKMRPDDVLRGLEGSVPALRAIKAKCPFVGYDNVRRNAQSSAVLSMATVLRYWGGSRPETPVASISGRSPAAYAKEIDDAELLNLIRFLDVAYSAWGRDAENFRLWGGLNLGLCMWIYRRTVINQDRGIKRAIVITNDQFKKCLMSLSASPDYLDWLSGRILADVHRTPGYRRIKAIFAARLREETGVNPKFPQPAWAA